MKITKTQKVIPKPSNSTDLDDDCNPINVTPKTKTPVNPQTPKTPKNK